MEKPETNLATTSAAEDRSPPHLCSQPQTPPPGGSSLVHGRRRLLLEALASAQRFGASKLLPNVLKALKRKRPATRSETWSGSHHQIERSLWGEGNQRPKQVVLYLCEVRSWVMSVLSFDPAAVPTGPPWINQGSDDAARSAEIQFSEQSHCETKLWMQKQSRST